MSYNNSEPEWVNWIEEAILKKHIKYYEYENFSNLVRIGTGGFGEAYRAKWKKSKILALKSLNNDTAVEKIVHELQIQRDVDFHENIIRFLGITIENPNNSSKKYMLVMEYADGGTLREHLRKNFGKLKWNSKLKMARQLSSAVSCLHNENTIHRDLYSNNVLIHKNNIKLADFGLSKKVEESVTFQQFGVIPYIDPKIFANDSYSRNEKSDVYSIGVLLWEISSGRPPFEGKSDHFLLTNIPNGLRETPIQDTPEGYEKIYTDCWKFEPYDRPTIYDVVNRLEAITSNKTTKSRTSPINDSSPSSRNNSLPSPRNNSSRNNSLPSPRNNSSRNNSSPSRNNSSPSPNNLSPLLRNNSSPSSRNNSSPSPNNLSPSLRNNSSPSSRNNSSPSLRGSESKKDIVDGIAALPYKIYDKSKKQKILDYLKDHQVTSKEILDWLKNNQNYPNSFLVLGDFHYLGIATKVDKKKAFKFYKSAGEGDDGLSVAQYNLGILCEIDKLGDTFLAIYWYKKSAEQGNHEAWESFNRLKNARNKTLNPSTIDKFDDMSIIFTP